MSSTPDNRTHPDTSQPECMTRTNMLSQDYHQAKEFLSNSAVSLYRRSPRLFGMWLRGDYHREPSKSMRIGSALDGLLTGTFQYEIAVAPECDRRTKVGKAIYEEFQETSFGKTVISVEEFELVNNMAVSARAHTLANSLLEEITACQSCLFWEDTVGLKWKCRFDAELSGDRILEIKTHAAFEREQDHAQEWADSCYRYGYHRQAALYQRGLGNYLSKKPQDIPHIVLAICNEPPHDVHVYHWQEAYLELGRQELDQAAAEIAMRKSLDHWELDNQPLTIGVPRWVKRKQRQVSQVPWGGF